MSRAGLEPTIPARQQPQAYALDRDAIQCTCGVKPSCCVQCICVTQFLSFLIMLIVYLLIFSIWIPYRVLYSVEHIASMTKVFFLLLLKETCSELELFSFQYRIIRLYNELLSHQNSRRQISSGLLPSSPFFATSINLKADFFASLRLGLQISDYISCTEKPFDSGVSKESVPSLYTIYLLKPSGNFTYHQV
jgi:hypothetical protein